MIDDPEFARRIRAARAYLGITLEGAGPELGLSTHQLSRRERADRNGFKFSAAERFHMTAIYAERTGWPETFFTGEDQHPPTQADQHPQDPE